MKNQCYIQIAIDHDNISICDCDRFVSQNCRYQYIISKGNPELCITLEDGTSIVASCIREFAVINNDSAICKITPNQKDVEYCYRDVAIRACNIEVCEGINDSVKKYACVNDIQIFCREIN